MTDAVKNTNAAEAAPLDGSAFARVLARIMEARSIPADEEHALELAEKSGLDREVFRARLHADPDADLYDLSRLAAELALSAEEMGALAYAYTYEHERESEEPRAKRVVRPEEVIADYEELPEDQRMRPLRCQVGRKGEDQCPRDATIQPYPESNLIPVMCEEHARAYELGMEVSEWSVAEEMTGDWLRLAQNWGFESLERIAENTHEDAKAGCLKATARADLAREIADAPRKTRKERIADLTPEQDANSRRLMMHADALVNARTMLEDYATGKANKRILERTLGILTIDAEHATEEAHRYQEEIGLRPAEV